MQPSNAHSQNAPQPLSLQAGVRADMSSLLQGDPDETVLVPMIHSTEKKSLKAMLVGGTGKVQQTVIVRKMKREWYLKHYAKDADGNYVGTEKPAADAGLVFVPSKSTPEDILQQVHKVAFGKQHYSSDYPSGWVITEAGGGAF
jgi:hypothetical protein